MAFSKLGDEPQCIVSAGLSRREEAETTNVSTIPDSLGSAVTLPNCYEGFCSDAGVQRAFDPG